MNKRELEILKIGFEAGKKAIEMHPDDDEYDAIRFEEAQEQVKNLDMQNVSKTEHLFCPDANCQSDNVYVKGNKCMCGYCGEKWTI